MKLRFMSTLLVCLSLIFFSSCNRKGGKPTSKVTLTFPGGDANQSVNSPVMNSITTQKPNFNYDNIPAKYDDVDCLAVFVGGPEASMRTNQCGKTLDKSQRFQFGVFAGTINKGSSLTMDVPSGSDRYIRMYGLKKSAEAKSCPSLTATTATDALLSGFSPPYFLGESKPTEMLPNASVTVEIPVVASIDPQAYFNDCTGPDFGSKNPDSNDPSNPGDDNPGRSSKPYLRLEGLHSFNLAENPSSARGMVRGSCYPVTFNVFSPCNGGPCTEYILKEQLNISASGRLKFFANSVNCQSHTSPISSFSIPPGQSKLPATGSYYVRMPLSEIGVSSTNLQGEISVLNTTEVDFTQPSHTHIEFLKPKIVVNNIPSIVVANSCASATTSQILAFEDSAMMIPAISHEPYFFSGAFLHTKISCSALVTSVPSSQSSLSFNFAKPLDSVGGISGAYVNAIFFDPAINKFYLGGGFSSYGGMAASSIVRLNIDGSVDTSFQMGSGIAGTVNSIISDGAGGIFVGGNFSMYNGSNVSNLIRLRSNGTMVDAFNFSVDASVQSLLLAGNYLYVGGAFLTINGNSHSRLAKIDIVTNTLDATNFSITGTSVNTITADLFNDALYIGGLFTNVLGEARMNIASVKISNSTLRTWYPVSGVNAVIMTSLLDPMTNNLFIGGGFTYVGGTARNRLAALNVMDGTVMGSFNPNVNSAVATMVQSGSNLIIGGSFTTVAGSTRNRVAALDIFGGSLMTMNPNFAGEVRTLSVLGMAVVAGGVFANFNAGAVSANKIGVFDVMTGGQHLGVLNPNIGTLIFNPFMYDYMPVIVY